MAHPSPRTQTRTILYVAPTEDVARDGAAALEAAAPSGVDGELTVRPIRTVGRLRELVPEADCVVCETVADDSVPAMSLLEVAMACEETPLVVVTDASYETVLTRSARRIDGYVRRGTGDVAVHLADEIARVCHAASTAANGVAEPEGETDVGTDSETSADGDEEATTEADADGDENEDSTADTETVPEPSVESNVDEDGTADAVPFDEPNANEARAEDPGTDDAADTDEDGKPEPVPEPVPDTASEPGDTVATQRGTTDVVEAETTAGRTAASTDSTALTDSSNTADGELAFRSVATRDGDETATALLETTAVLVDCRDRERLFAHLVAGAIGVLGFEYCWLSTVHFGELVPRAAAPAVPDDDLSSTSVEGPLGEVYRTGEPVRIDDIAAREDVDPPFAGVRSLCTVPLGDVGILRVAAREPDAIDERDRELLDGLCSTAAAVLERNWDEMGVVNERNRLERECERLEREREQFADATERLADERDRLVAERDQLLALVEDVAKPTIRYEIVDGEAVIRDVNAAVETVFGDDREAITGEPVREYVVPAGLDERADVLEEALRADEQHQLLDRRETVDGMRDFMLTVVPLERTVDGAARSGAEHEGLLVYRDITESKRRELELAAATERLERIAGLIDEDVGQPLHIARSYLELAEKTGNEEHFDVIETAHERIRERLHAVEDVATWTDASGEPEPVAIHDVATRAWTAIDTGNAKLVTEDDLILEADSEQLRELFEYVLRTAIEVDDVAESEPDEARAGDADGSVTITVGATDDGFYVAGDRPAASESADGRQEAPTPGRLTASDGAGLQLDLVERIAAEHGWDVGVAEDEDGTAFAFRGIDAISVNRNRV